MCSAILGEMKARKAYSRRCPSPQETWVQHLYDVRTQSGHRARRQCAAAVAVLTRRVTNPAGMGGRSLSGAGVEPQTLLFTHRLLLLVLRCCCRWARSRLAVLVQLSVSPKGAPRTRIGSPHVARSHQSCCRSESTARPRLVPPRSPRGRMSPKARRYRHLRSGSGSNRRHKEGPRCTRDARGHAHAQIWVGGAARWSQEGRQAHKRAEAPHLRCSSKSSTKPLPEPPPGTREGRKAACGCTSPHALAAQRPFPRQGRKV